MGVGEFSISDPINRSCVLTVLSQVDRSIILDLITSLGFEISSVTEE